MNTTCNNTIQYISIQCQSIVVLDNDYIVLRRIHQT